MMKKLWIIIFVLTMAVAFAACSDSADGGNAEAKDRIDYIELGEMDAGVAYWEAAIKEDIDWDALGTEAQAATAVEAVVDCVGRAETPSVDLCQVEGCQGEMGMPAFLWSGDQNDLIVIYLEGGEKEEEYKLSQEELNRVLSAKGFKLKEDEWD